MKKPYLKKYNLINGYSVWIVDGEYIRGHIDEEFTNFGLNPRFKFIPKKELWVDKEYGNGDEIEYYIKNMLKEEEIIKRRRNIDYAIDEGDKIEKKERKKHERIEKKPHCKKEILKNIHVKLIKKWSKGLKVWIVNGRIVRDCYFLDFTEGGHEFVYKFVPKNEIWIDDDLREKERKFVFLHEIHERNLMKKGMKYEHAHHSSSIIELHCRKNPKLTNKKIQEELKK
jgi:hypothetical protein